MTFENVKSNMDSPLPYEEEDREMKTKKNNHGVMASFDLMYSESALAAIGTCNGSSEIVTGENIKMITDLGNISHKFIYRIYKFIWFKRSPNKASIKLLNKIILLYKSSDQTYFSRRRLFQHPRNI